MPEGMNIEVAHKLSEQDRADRAKRRWEEITEILEVLILAVAAIATAWSGYQAARGDRELQAMFVQRFKLRGVRMAAMGLAVGLLVYGLVTAATLPRL